MGKIYLYATISVNDEQIINSKLMGLLHEMNNLSFNISKSFVDKRIKPKQTIVIFKNNTSQNAISLLFLLSEQLLIILIKKIEELTENAKYSMKYIVAEY